MTFINGFISPNICRGLGEDEPTSVSFPTRTVLITGLDATITPLELKAAFDQYGDIVVSFFSSIGIHDRIYVIYKY